MKTILGFIAFVIANVAFTQSMLDLFAGNYEMAAMFFALAAFHFLVADYFTKG